MNTRDSKATARELTHFIGGKHVKGESGRFGDVYNPSTGQVTGRVPLATSGANVIAGSAGPECRTVTIDKGQADGFGADMPVLAPAGVVGRLILPTPRASKVQLLIDRNAAAAALIERSRAQGVVVGTGGPRLHMEYVPGSADVRVGDTVVTSGIDGIYPKGYAIGRIESVQRSAEGWTIDIAPAVDFSSLEAVLVVQGRAPVEPAVPALAAVSPASTSHRSRFRTARRKRALPWKCGTP